MSNLMVIKNCDKFDNCIKILMVIDKDILEQQKAELICEACNTCKERISVEDLK